MYNRYVPQSDGSYRRNTYPSPAPEPPRRPPENPQPPIPCEPPPPPPCSRSNGNVGDFLRRLLPKNLDTGDLLIIVLLLLMSGDCQEDQNTALLTLVLYLFL